jgi:hypothetical protein
LNAVLYPTWSAPGSTTCPTLGDWLVSLYPLSAFVPLPTSARC